MQYLLQHIDQILNRTDTIVLIKIDLIAVVGRERGIAETERRGVIRRLRLIPETVGAMVSLQLCWQVD